MTTQNQSSTPNINFIKPDYLKKGDRVAIVAPAGTLQGRHKAIEKAESLLKEWGLVPILGQHLFVQNNHFAGKDSERLSDFQWALDSAEIKAIWCARGGYGTTRIIDGFVCLLVLPAEGNFCKEQNHTSSACARVAFTVTRMSAVSLASCAEGSVVLHKTIITQSHEV